jgi:prepilin-type N-terminal cleavage/methylation domain-containing protein
MVVPSFNVSDGRARLRHTVDRGFTLFEVMLAAFVLAMVIASSLTVVQVGMRAVDTARNMTLANQVCQSAIEVLRLQNWAQISALPAVATVSIPSVISSGSSTSLDATLNSFTGLFTCTRTVADPKTNMRVITITVTWTGNDGRPHSVSTQARYAKNGLNDYIYVAH